MNRERARKTQKYSLGVGGLRGWMIRTSYQGTEQRRADLLDQIFATSQSKEVAQVQRVDTPQEYASDISGPSWYNHVPRKVCRGVAAVALLSAAIELVAVSLEKPAAQTQEIGPAHTTCQIYDMAGCTIPELAQPALTHQP